MVRVLDCNRCGSVTSYDTVEELVTRVQQHHREAHQDFLSRQQVLLLAQMQSWGSGAGRSPGIRATSGSEW